jgi:hypothetical protein
MQRYIDLTGRRFDRLLVLSRAGNDKRGKTRWLCRCDCGVEKIVGGQALRDGAIKSCGCFHRDEMTERLTTHGKTKTRIYRIYNNIIARCYKPTNTRYSVYGGRGISVCEEWRNSFQAFCDWAMTNGYRDDLTIDRINNDGNYEPSNCRWIGNKDQQSNRSDNHYITCFGKTQTLQQWADEYGIRFNTIIGRLVRGWDIERALTTKVKRRKSN